MGCVGEQLMTVSFVYVGGMGGRMGWDGYMNDGACLFPGLSLLNTGTVMGRDKS